MTSLKRKLSVILLAVSISNAAAGCGSLTYPSDDEMIDRFRNNIAEFEILVSMFEQDAHLQWVEPSGAWANFDERANIAEERLDQYRGLLLILGVENMSRIPGNKSESIYLRVWNDPSFFIGGSTKYYTYTKVEPEPLVDSLDDVYSSGRDASDFRKIEGNWYLFLDVW